jgi:hypothetical protein
VPQAGKPAGVVVVVAAAAVVMAVVVMAAVVAVVVVVVAVAVVVVVQGCAPASTSEFDITYFSTVDDLSKDKSFTKNTFTKRQLVIFIVVPCILSQSLLYCSTHALHYTLKH